MSTHTHIHADHPNRHGPGCGHIAIKHGDHVDYLHDGHLHHQEGDVVEEHVIEVSATILTIALQSSVIPATTPPTCTGRAADIRRSRMATTSIISSTEGSIIRTAIIAMITASSIPSIRSFYSGSSNDRSCGARRAMCALPRLIDRGASSDSLAAALAASGIVECPGFAATGCGSGAASDREHQNQLQIPCKRGPPHMLLCLASQCRDDAALRNGSALALVDELPEFTA